MAAPKRFLLRIDPRLFDALRRWADDDLRSVNAQIEYLLADRVRRAGRLPARRAKPSNAGQPPDASSNDAEGEPDSGPDEPAGGHEHVRDAGAEIQNGLPLG